jgi:hypothetical protein
MKCRSTSSPVTDLIGMGLHLTCPMCLRTLSTRVLASPASEFSKLLSRSRRSSAFAEGPMKAA